MLFRSVPDLAAAANRMLAELRMPQRAVAEVRDFVGKGTAKLVERCLGVNRARFDEAMPIFNRVYREESGKHSKVFPRVIEGLQAIADAGLPMGCVTNKPGEFTLPLLQETGLVRYFIVVVSGDTVATRKPDPLPMRYACERLGVATQESLVVGDSENDVQAARAAGCPVVCVPYGYREGLDRKSTRLNSSHT